MGLPMMLAVALGLVALFFVGRTVMRAYRRSRGTRVITCPENHQTAAVKVDGRAATIGEITGKHRLRLSDCSRWPEKGGCEQECLRQIEAAPDGCLLRNVLDSWYAGKSCALCGAKIGPIHWHDHRPGLLDENGITADWASFPPEQLPHALETHRPICWNCQIAETFRRRFPDRVVDRNRPPAD